MTELQPGRIRETPATTLAAQNVCLTTLSRFIGTKMLRLAQSNTTRLIVLEE